MPVYCQGCKSELDPSATSCNICLRARSRAEIFRGLRGVQEEKDRPAKRRKFVLSFLVLLISIGAAGYLHKDRLLGLLSPPAAPSPAAPAETPAPVSEPTPPPQATPIQPQPYEPAGAEDRAKTAAYDEVQSIIREARDQRPEPEEPAPSPYTTELPERYASERPEPEGYMWTVYGKAYDLFSLKPVAGAVVTFKSKGSDQSFKTKTGKDGTYSVTMPPEDEVGYLATVSHKLYRSDYLDEMSPPYHSLPLSRREDAAMLMNTSAILHVPIFLNTDEPEARFNFVMLPMR